MKLRRRIKGKERQRGMALLIFAAIAGVVAIALLIGQLNNANIRLERDKITADALAKAKDALIAYAVGYDLTHANTVPGFLPCPEIASPGGPGTEGQSTSPCGLQDISVLGKLPWKTLGIVPLRDGDNECLWYAVSGSHKNNPATAMMNWDTLGQFDVVADDGSTTIGTTPHNRAVAIIFAPGSTLPGQDRSAVVNTPNCGGNYTASNYLDSQGAINNSAVTAGHFIAGNRSGTFNDRFIVITADDIFNAVRRRVDFQGQLDALALKAAQCIVTYGGNNGGSFPDYRLPWAARIDLADFLSNPSYDDDALTTPLSGRFPYVVKDSKVATGNSIIGFNLPTNTNCGYSLADDAWYKNWKDHLFYALAGPFKPNALPPTRCLPSSSCLKVNGSGPIAAVVIFAGPRLAGQSRATSLDKSKLSNYLEGGNFSNHPNSSGNSDYQSGLPSSSFNDKVVCVGPQPLWASPC